MTSLPRRTFLAGAFGAGAVALEPSAASAARRTAALVSGNRPTLPSGVMSGDVTPRSAVLWARSSGPGRLVARVASGHRSMEVRGGFATESSDYTAKIPLSGLTAGRDYDVSLHFESAEGRRGEVGHLAFRTPSLHRAAQRFVWSGDSCGQGWGINPDLGGLLGYRAMHLANPDFFLHAGDTIYADGPISESVTEPDGQVWRNVVTPEVSKVAEELHEFRGRQRYTLMDDNVKALYGEVPLVAQWDDHETHNNWYPGQILDDNRYTEKRVDVLAARARQAWQEYMPIADVRATRPGTGFEPARIYRKVSRGAHLDVFCLDMRTHKDPNTPGLEDHRTSLLGKEQADWLVREVAASTATWKVISADLPLGLVVPDGPVNEESLSNRDPGAPLGKELELAAVLSGFKKHGVKNVLWVTADVHYAAAHHYDPSRAAFTDFDPFWEIVAGPIAAGTFGPNQLDQTFGPSVEFTKVADYPNQSPRGGNQFFGQVDITSDGLLTVSLHDLSGTTLWSKDMEPERT